MNNLTCKLTTPELKERRATVIATLRDLLIKKEELTDGLKFTFSSEDKILDKLLDFIKSERLCCDFFTFRLTVIDELAILEVTGPEGAKEFLEQEVGF